MRLFYSILGVAVIVIALSVSYYFVIFLPQEQTQQDLAKNQASCLELEQSIVKEGNARNIQGEDLSGKNYYNPILKKCFVETEDNIIGGTVITQSYTIYDATEDGALADCIISSSSHAPADTLCFDDSQRAKNNGSSPTITKSQFDSLETQYMGS